MEKHVLQQTVIRVEEQLRSVQTSVSRFLVQPDTLYSFRSNDLVSDFQLFNRLRKECSAFLIAKHSGIELLGITVINLKDNWAYDTDIGYQSTLENITVPPVSLVDGWGVEMRYAKNNLFQYVPANYVLSGYVNFLDQGIVAAKVDYAAFKQNVDALSPSSTLYITDASGRIIYDGTTENLGASVPFTLPDDDREVLRLERDGKRYIGIRLTSAEFGWTYLSVRESLPLDGDMFLYIMITPAVTLAMILIASILMSRHSRNIYTPVYNLSKKLEASAIHAVALPERGVDEFMRIETSVNVIINDNKRLENDLEDQRLISRELMMYRLFSGYVSDPNTLERYNIKLPWKSYALAGICFKDSQEKDELDLQFIRIHRLINEILPTNSLVSPAILDNLVVFIIGGNQDNFSEYSAEAARQLYHLMIGNLGINIQLALSCPFTELYHIPREFVKVRRVLSMRDIPSSQGITLLAENTSFHYPHKASDDLVNGIKLNREAEIDASLELFLHSIYDRDSHNPDNQQMCILWLVGDILRLTPDYSGYILNQAASSQNEDLIYTLLEIETIEEKKAWLLTHIIRPVCSLLHTDDANKLFIVNNMLRFIHGRTQGVCDIEECAAYLNYNPAYLRKVFFDKMEISFSQYAYRYTLEQSKEMILSSTLPISVIAEKHGYSNSQNFIRSFKKEFGITPGQFRSSAAQSSDV